LARPVEQGGAGMGIVGSLPWIIPVQLGAYFGYLTFGFIADRIGRRQAFVFYTVAAAVLVPIYGQMARSPMVLLLLGPPLGYFGYGYFSMFGGFVAELFPAAVRATGQGTTYNIGRMAGAVAPFTIGVIATQPGIGIGLALSITSAFFLLAAALGVHLARSQRTGLGRIGAQMASNTTADRAVGWQVWVPCIGMALCSWLSFVDRQVLNILAPTIIKDTGLTNQDFTAATSFFFLTYTLGNPVWGTVIDYIGPAQGACCWPSPCGPAASMSHSMMASFAGFRARARGAGRRAKAARSRAAAHRGRNTVAGPARPRHRLVVQRRHHRRGDDAAPPRSAGHQIRMA
jgi:MFS family permease